MSSQNSSVLISDIYKSRKIILELMLKQGYNVKDYSNFSINEVNSMKQNNQLDMLLETNDDISKKKKIYIRYYLAKAIRPSNLHEMIDDLFILSETLKKEDTLFIIINLNQYIKNQHLFLKNINSQIQFRYFFEEN